MVSLALVPRPKIAGFLSEHEDARRTGSPVNRPGTVPSPPTLEQRPLERIPQKPESKYLYFVLDDGGHNLSQLKPFLEFPGKLTIAVIPGLTYSTQAARAVVQAGKELILHFPMEALDMDAGPEALKVGDSDVILKSKLSQALESVPGARGVNNHMGSRATEDPRLMTMLLLELKNRKLFFLDSFTSPRSVAQEVGRKMNFQVWERNVFLDNEKTREFILQAIEEGKKVADQKGHAVMIGHVWTSELAEVLTDIYPQLLEEGYTLEDLSHLFSLPVSDDSTGN